MAAASCPSLAHNKPTALHRLMAEETINTAVASGRLPMDTKPCVTDGLALLGATSYHQVQFTEVRWSASSWSSVRKLLPPGSAH